VKKGVQRGKEPEWAMGRRGGGARRVHYAPGTH
jgi:hypothetical protein